MQNNESIKSWYTQFWPWFIISLPASVVVAGIITVVIAFRNEDSLVGNDYYRDGLAVNQKLDLENNANKLGLKASLRFDRYTGEIRVALSGELLQTPESLSLLLSHPVDQQQDLLISLKRTPHNDYLAQLKSSLDGRWYIQLSDSQRAMWRLNTQINLRNETQVDFGNSRAFQQ